MSEKNSNSDDENAKYRIAIGERLKVERDRLGISVADLAQSSSLPKRTIYGWETGATTPKADFFAANASLGLDVAFILTGKRARTTLAEVQDSGVGRYNLAGTAPSPSAGDTDDTVFIDLLSASGSMGPGNEVLTEDVVMGRVPFSRRWLSQHLPRSRPRALKLVHAYGDSMKGTLESGDFGIVDTDMNTPDVDGVYVLQAHNRLFIKRVTQRLDGTHVVSSDNPLVTQTDVLNGLHEVRVCGRVVYGWNGRRF